MFSLGVPELLLILLVAVLLFGGTRLPGLARGVAQGIREFRHALKPAAGNVETMGTDFPMDDKTDDVIARDQEHTGRKSAQTGEATIEL